MHAAPRALHHSEELGRGVSPFCGGSVEVWTDLFSRIEWNNAWEWVMEYGKFIIKAFERKPSKWRAMVRRSDGKPLMVTGRAKLDKFITGVDAATAQNALLMAIAAIDAEAFSRRGSFAPPQAVVAARNTSTAGVTCN